MNFLRNSYLALIARVIVGAVLVFSATTKLVHPADFALIVQGYEVLPASLVALVAAVLPWIEIVVGGFILFGLFTRLALPIAGLMLAFFLILMAAAWAQGKPLDCGCFIGVITETIGPLTLVRDLIILALVVPAYLGLPHRVSLDQWLRSSAAPRVRGAIASLALAMVAIAFGLFVSTFAVGASPSPSNAAAAQSGPSSSGVAQSSTNSRQGWRLGAPTAKVVITEFGDYQCGACRAMGPALKQLLADYGGQVALVYRHFPLPGHDLSEPAAEAAEAAGEQGKFWEMSDLLYADQARLSPQDLLARASYLKLDMRKFEDAIASGRARKNVQADFEEGKRIGITHTPWIMINGRPVESNAYATIKAAIDKELAK